MAILFKAGERGETVIEEIRRRVRSRDKGRCRYCGRQCVSQKRHRGRADSLTYDHVVPLSAGGLSNAANVVIACRECNEIKASMILSRKQLQQLESLARSGYCEQAARQLLREWKARR